MNNPALIKAALVALSFILGGCASIVGGTTQVVTIEASNKSEPVIGAMCKLVNDKGVFYVTTPGTVSVHRAYGDLTVRCEKESLPPGLAVVKSSTKALAFGNILAGGVIGAAVDTGSGAAYDYPTLIRISMGEIVELKGNGQPAAPPPSGYAELKDSDKLTQFGPKVKDGYEKFLTRPLPRAFAIGENGKWWSSWGNKPKDLGAPKEPYIRAIQDCEAHHRTKCVLYAVDNNVVYQPEMKKFSDAATKKKKD